MEDCVQAELQALQQELHAAKQAAARSTSDILPARQAKGNWHVLLGLDAESDDDSSGGARSIADHHGHASQHAGTLHKQVSLLLPVLSTVYPRGLSCQETTWIP